MPATNTRSTRSTGSKPPGSQRSGVSSPRQTPQNTRTLPSNGFVHAKPLTSRGRLRVRRTDSGASGKAGTPPPLRIPPRNARQNVDEQLSNRSHLKRPASQNSRPGKKAKPNHQMQLRYGAASNDRSEPLASTPRDNSMNLQSNITSPRPCTPDSVRRHQQHENLGELPSNAVNSPLSLAKKNAKVPQLYLSAGTTPPPSQVYRTKKRMQKRILVLSGNVTHEDYSVMNSENEPPHAIPYEQSPTIFRLPPVPTEAEMNQKLTEDETPPEVSKDCISEEDEPLTYRKSIDPEDPCRENHPDVSSLNPKQHQKPSTQKGTEAIKKQEDVEFLLARHRPVSEAYHIAVCADSEAGAKTQISFDEVKEDIKKSLTQPIGKERSFIGEILSRDVVDITKDIIDSPPSGSRRTSAPVFSESPLCIWNKNHLHNREIVRRVSEGGVPIKDEKYLWPATPENPTVTVNSNNSSPNMNSDSGHTELASPDSGSSAPFESGSDQPQAPNSMQHTTSSSIRTLDEPENHRHSREVSRPSRRRSISEPRGRSGGPGGVVGPALKDAIPNSFFTLNPSIFEDQRVWGIPEFRKLCTMLNVDASKCRDFQDYVTLLNEWNHKPNVSLAMDSNPISSTYYSGDIQIRTLGNFNNIPVLASKVPHVYRRLIEPLKAQDRLESCFKHEKSRKVQRSPSTRLHFSPYNHNRQFYLSPSERYDKRLCLHQIASMTSISNNEEGVDAQVILLDPTRELNGDPDWECAKSNMNRNLIMTNPRFQLDDAVASLSDKSHSLRVHEISNSQDTYGDWFCDDS